MENAELDEMVVEETEEDQEQEVEATEEEETEEEADEVETTETEEEEDDEDAEEIIEIEGITPPDQEETGKAPGWVRDLRKRNKELNEKVKKLESEQQNFRQSTTLPDRPKLEDFDYDQDEYDKAVDKWVESKEAYTKQLEEQAKVQAEQQQEFQKVIERYDSHKAKLRVKDYDIAEGLVEDSLSYEQQAIVLKYAEDPAKLVYALGMNKKTLNEVAEEKDPIMFALAMKDLQSKITVRKPKRAPKPEGKISGGANASGVDSTLDALRKEADKTGDYSKVVAYKRQKKGS